MTFPANASAIAGHQVAHLGLTTRLYETSAWQMPGRGRLLTLDGPSLRTQHLGLDESEATTTSAQVARIPGIRAPAFPEPTTTYFPSVPAPLNNTTARRAGTPRFDPPNSGRMAEFTASTSPLKDSTGPPLPPTVVSAS